MDFDETFIVTLDGCCLIPYQTIPYQTKPNQTKPYQTISNPPWSPHRPLTTPYYPLTNPTQLIKFDLVNFLLDTKQTNRPNLRYEKNRALRALIFSALRAARSLRELGAFGPYGWPSATWDHRARSNGDVRPSGRRRPAPAGDVRRSPAPSGEVRLRPAKFKICWTK